MTVVRVPPSGHFQEIEGGGGAPLSAVFWCDANTATPTDEQDGSIGKPFSDLQVAHDAVPDGSTLLLVPGEYGDLQAAKILSLRGLGGNAGDSGSQTVTIGSVDMQAAEGTNCIITLELLNAGAVNAVCESSAFVGLVVRASRVESVDMSGEGLCSCSFEGWGSPRAFSWAAAVCLGAINLSTAGTPNFFCTNARINSLAAPECAAVLENSVFQNDVTVLAASVRNCQFLGSLFGGDSPGLLEIDDASWNERGPFLTGFAPIRVVGSARNFLAQVLFPPMSGGGSGLATAIVPGLNEVNLGVTSFPVGLTASWIATDPPSVDARIGILGAWISNWVTGEVTIAVLNIGPGAFPAGQTAQMIVTLLQQGQQT